MRFSRVGFLTHRALLVLMAIFAFAAGIATAAWFYERQRADCWRDKAEQGVAPEGVCD